MAKSRAIRCFPPARFLTSLLEQPTSLALVGDECQTRPGIGARFGVMLQKDRIYMEGIE